MEIEWDSKKAISNLKKHGIDFADAVSVLLVYTWRETRIRIISARKATAREIQQYKD